MDTQPPAAVTIRTPADLIAALPALLGYHPSGVLVIIALRASRVLTLATIDLAAFGNPDAASHLTEAVTRLAAASKRHHADSAHIVVVGPAPDTDQPTPTPAMLEPVRAALSAEGLHLAHAAFTPAIEDGARWHCLDDPACHGRLPDPQSTLAAATEVAAGRPIYRSRTELTDTLRGDHPDALTRRARLIATAQQAAAHTDPATLQARHRRLIADAIAHARHGVLPDTDEQIADLAVAIADPPSRDAALAFSLAADADAAIRLWSALVRQVPAPHRAEPATLLAVAAHLGGHGALANAAIQVALDAVPGHRLATLLAAAYSFGLAPHEMRDVVTETLALQHPDRP